MRARANLASHDWKRMNGVEARYALLLEEEIRSGSVVRWRFEPMKLRLGSRLTYAPDFLVVDASGLLYLDEVKTRWTDGREGWREDSRVKWKAAAELYPEFVFRAAVWGREEKRWQRYEWPSSSSSRDGDRLAT